MHRSNFMPEKVDGGGWGFRPKGDRRFSAGPSPDTVRGEFSATRVFFLFWGITAGGDFACGDQRVRPLDYARTRSGAVIALRAFFFLF